MNFGLVFAFLGLLFCNGCLSLTQEQVSDREIKHFVAFLEENLNRTVLNYTFNPLTKPGDNFGGVLQSVDVKVTNGKNEETLNLVVKIAVTTDELVAVFQPSITFVKETEFYANVIPAIEEFERTQNISEAERLDIFIPCVAFRNSLNSSAETADADAVLVLENMKPHNYSNGDRLIGMDTEDTIVVLKNLAKFHATSIAMRRLQPKLFESKVKPYLAALTGDTEPQSVEKKINIISEELKNVKNISVEVIKTIEHSMKLSLQFYGNPDLTNKNDTPYTTIVHEDFWINNVMMKKDPLANVSSIKMYDFQMCFRQSFVHDLIFFLFTSVQPSHLTANFKLFFEQYHMEFIKTLSLAKCPLDEYTFEKMWKEIQERAKLELYRLLWRAKLILGTHDGTESKIPPKIVLDKWRLTIDLFSENQFL